MRYRVSNGPGDCVVSGIYQRVETRDLEPATRTTHLVAVQSGEAGRYLDFIKGRGWRKADFTRFSSRTNPAASADDFSLHSLLSS